MVDLAFAVATASFSILLAIYGLYIITVLRNRKTREYIELVNKTLENSSNYQSLPNVTILVPTFNEETHISRKLENIAQLRYPLEKIEILVIDDCSADRTCEIAQSKLRELGLCGRVIRNTNRIGVNASYNTGMTNTSNGLILRTDADIVIEPDALEKAVQIITNVDNAGGVTGTMMPVSTDCTAATIVENNYRNLFDRMATAESALHSAFLGGGGFALLKRSVFSPISTSLGSTDANISLSIIRKGFRYLYVPRTFSREAICHRLNEQVRQKVRRASRLIQSTLMNRDIIFRKELQEFGLQIFPLRFAMLTICPFLMFAGLFSAFFLILSYSVVFAALSVLAICILVYLGTSTKSGPLNSLTSFFIHQSYLLIGLFFLGKKMSVWKRIEESTFKRLE